MREGAGHTLWVLTVFLLCLLATRSAEAVNPETLLMPGKLSTAHAKYEADCTSCHDRSNRTRQPQLCLECHKGIAEDVRATRGLHGRLSGAMSLQCRACHSEHRGRDADIVKFSRDQFHHERTDFPLRGAHSSLSCGACHQKGKKFSSAASDCYSCHRQQEPHAGKLGHDC